MTLHEAIAKLLHQTGQSMTTNEIADELNKNNWYEKKDGSAIQPYQIHGRTRKYPQLFNRKGISVSLIGGTNIKVFTPKKQIKKPIRRLTQISNDIVVLEKVLINEKNFKSAVNIDLIVPYTPGFYCIRIKNIKKLPNLLKKIIQKRKNNIIYIGVATQSLNKRFLKQELRATGHGTFFRSIGAILGFRPPKGSLKDKSNKRNYKFSSIDEGKIIEWININLSVNWIEFDGNFKDMETMLIEKYLPLLNIAKNPFPLKELSEMRAECVKIANK